MKRHLLTLYTRTPLHVGSGSSVDVVDLPIMRERISGFPIIPASSLKGVLRQWARDAASISDDELRALFGDIEEIEEGGEKKHISWAGCVQIMEAKILAFPVRSLAGCFAWITCPAALARFQRDTGRLTETKDGKSAPLKITEVAVDHVLAGSDLHVKVAGQDVVVLEEFALKCEDDSLASDLEKLASELASLCADPLWSAHLTNRLAIVNDENFQHFVTTCTEVVTRIAIDPQKRTVKDGHLFNQENIPCETLFYTVLTVLPQSRKPGANGFDADSKLAELLPAISPPLLQIGGDETTGHGLCEIKREVLTK